MTAPVKTSDGKYFLTLRQPRIQLNSVGVNSDGNIGPLTESDLAKMAEQDSLLISQAKENCELWFGKKLSDEFLENVYDSPIQDDGLLVARLARDSEGTVLTKFFNEKREPVKPEDITGPYDVIVELYGVQFVRRGYNPVWRILQVRERPKPKPEIPDEYMFQDE